MQSYQYKVGKLNTFLFTKTLYFYIKGWSNNTHTVKRSYQVRRTYLLDKYMYVKLTRALILAFFKTMLVDQCESIF